MDAPPTAPSPRNRQSGFLRRALVGGFSIRLGIGVDAGGQVGLGIGIDAGGQVGLGIGIDGRGQVGLGIGIDGRGQVGLGIGIDARQPKGRAVVGDPIGGRPILVNEGGDLDAKGIEGVDADDAVVIGHGAEAWDPHGGKGRGWADPAFATRRGALPILLLEQRKGAKFGGFGTEVARSAHASREDDEKSEKLLHERTCL